MYEMSVSLPLPFPLSSCDLEELVLTNLCAKRIFSIYNIPDNWNNIYICPRIPTDLTRFLPDFTGFWTVEGSTSVRFLSNWSAALLYNINHTKLEQSSANYKPKYCKWLLDHLTFYLLGGQHQTINRLNSYLNLASAFFGWL